MSKYKRKYEIGDLAKIPKHDLCKQYGRFFGRDIISIIVFEVCHEGTYSLSYLCLLAIANPATQIIQYTMCPGDLLPYTKKSELHV